jgi:hypothetical protein
MWPLPPAPDPVRHDHRGETVFHRSDRSATARHNHGNFNAPLA